MTTTAPVLASPAWIIGGLHNRPGHLVTADGRIAFTDGETTYFDAPLSAVTDVKYPWYWFGGGFVARVAGEKYKVTFVKPNGMPSPNPSSLELGLNVLGVAAAFSAAHGVSHLGDLAGLAWIAPGRAATKRWREILPA